MRQRTDIKDRSTARRVGCALVACLLTFVMAGAPAAGQIPCKFDAEILPRVNCGGWEQGIVPTAINLHGHVAGWSSNCGTPIYNRSYLWLGDTPGAPLIAVPNPSGAAGFSVAGLNDEGIMCGTAQFSNGQQRAYVYNRTANQWTQIPPVNTQVGWSEATALNNAGIVVGYRGIGNDIQGRPFNAFIFDSNTGTITDLGVMNGPNSGAYAVSDNGTVVGWTGLSGVSLYEDTRAFIHKRGLTTVLGPVPDGFSSVAVALNNHQVLVQGMTQSLRCASTGRIFSKTTG